MNVKAALNTSKVFGYCAVGSITVCTIFRLVPLEYISAGLMVAAVVMAAKGCYETEREKLEALDRLNNTK